MAARLPSLGFMLSLGGLLALASGCSDDRLVQPEGVNADVIAQANGPTVLDPNLEVRTVVDGMVTPISIAFLGPDDMLVLEKVTGRVQRVTGGVVQGTVLDLAVNFASERGLLGIALHPAFPTNPGVYLYWTESTTGDDTSVLSATPLLGNRVDRFTWNGSTLTLDHNLIRLRAIQQDADQPERGNHDGGVIRFGPDGKLYIFIGDVGRRGGTQNLRCGPTDRYDCPRAAEANFGTVPDDQFGGPEPDDAHLTGVILRLNDDGTTPADNPFSQFGALLGGAVSPVVGANVRKIFSYGHRNSFGMAFDPRSGNLWLQENGDDSFTELNRVRPGMNGGWIQIMGPVSRINQFKQIETSPMFFGLQQIRWPPTNIADTPEEALARLSMMPGARYVDPAFSWKYEIAPGGIGFVRGRALGPQYDGNLIMGAARDLLEGGHLFRFRLTGNRRNIAVDDPRLEDRVADNLAKWEITESESLLFGTDFGVGTDVQTGPNGNLFIVSLSHGAIYEIFRR
ncbi:MAG: PQQ-dependent sugar dehydrogenase [Longimicrobiaceae bacterium]